MEETNAQASAAFSEEEQRMVAAYAGQIDLADAGLVLRYGAGAQRQVAQCASRALAVAQHSTLDDAARLVAEATDELRAFSAGGRGPFARLRGRAQGPAALRKRCVAMAARVDDIAAALRTVQRALMKDAALLDQMHAANDGYVRELELYLAAGRQALAAAPAEGGARQAGDRAAAGRERFEKKLHDLDLSRMVALQTGPQIRLLQRAQQTMVDKIQTTLVTTIPLWKNQAAIALGLADAQAARAAQEAFEAASDEALVAHAEDLRREAASLADALADVARAQSEERGRMDRAQAEIERLQLPAAPTA